jgi:hypothetical protein
VSAVIRRGDAPPAVRAVVASTLDGMADGTALFSDLSLGAWRPNQVAAEFCRQLGIEPATSGWADGTRLLERSLRRSTADVIGALIDGETSGHRPTLVSLELAERVAAALVPTGAPARLLVLAPLDGGGLGEDNESFLAWLASAAPERVEVVVTGRRRPPLPAHWAVSWHEEPTSAVPEPPRSPLVLVPGLVPAAVAEKLAPGGAPARSERLPGGLLLVPPELRGDPAAQAPELVTSLAELADDPWIRAYAVARGGVPCNGDELLALAWRALTGGAYDLALRLAEAAAAFGDDERGRGRARAVADGMRIGIQDFQPLADAPEPAASLPPRLRGLLVQSKGWGLAMTGRADEAAPLLEQAGGLLRGDRPTREYLYLLNIAALVHMRRGDIDGAMRLEEDIARELGQLEAPDWHLSYVNRLNRARLHLRRGELDRAETLFAQAFEPSRGLWTLGDVLARHVYAARIAGERGDRHVARRSWLATALLWASDAVPEAVPTRAARMIVGGSAPRHRLAAEVSQALCAQLAGAFDVTAPDGEPRLDPPALVRSTSLPPDLRSHPTAEAVGCADWMVVALPTEAPAGHDGAAHRRLRSLLHELLSQQQPVAALRDARTLVVDDRLGRDMPRTPAETVAACLRLGVPRAWYDGELLLDASSDRRTIERRQRVTWSDAVDRRGLDDETPTVAYRRYREPLRLAAEDAQLLRELEHRGTFGELLDADEGADPDALLARLRALERERVVTVDLAETAVAPVVTCAPSAELARAFGEHGFVRLDSFGAPDEMAVLAEYVDRAIERGARRGAAGAGSGSGHRGDKRRGELVWLPKPEQHAPELAGCFALRRARRLAAALLDVDEEQVEASPRIFFKPPRAGTPVPWHQDDAYRPPGEQRPSLNVWIPLDEATPESGCLHFVPGSHRGGLRTHGSYAYDPTGLTLEAPPQPDETVTACPLPVGAASAHHCRTLHFSTPNRSERRRRALVIVCEVS